MATVTVHLYRDSLQTAWGFRVQGGADFHTPLTVQRVFTGSPAEGELHRGDVLLGIDNYDTAGMLHMEAQDVIRNSGGTLVLSLRRPHGSTTAAPRAAAAGAPHTRGPSQPTWRPSGPRPEFGVQYGRQQAGAPQHHNRQQQLPAQQSREANADNYMMDRLNRSLAGMDLQAAGQRSLDDQDVDYGFTQQSVADRRKAFMQQNNYGNTYHSVPRPNPAASAAAARYRQKRPPDPVLGQRVPEFGWSPSVDKLRQARGVGGSWGPSNVGYEQPSYLPSQGQGREDSPFRASAGRSGRGQGGGQSGGHGHGGGHGGHGGGHGAHGGGHGAHGGGHGAHGGGHGAHGGGHGAHGGGHGGLGHHSGHGGGLGSGGAGRQRSSATLRLNSTGGGGGGGGGGIVGGDSGGVADVPQAFNKQYNTPINMYSKQNVTSAFEGQTGIALDPNHTNSEPAYNQSQVYKLVQEQDQRRTRQRQPQPQKQPLQQSRSAPPAWVRQQSEGDDFGLSEF